VAIPEEAIMRNGNLTLTILVSLFCAVGCGGPIADIESMTKEICACEDLECATKAKESYAGKYDKEDMEALSDDDKGKLLAQGLKQMECMKKLK
jgi:hypothetical protein